LVTRTEALALINRQDAKEIWQAAPEFSAALRSFRIVNMGKKQTRYPVLGALPTAAFVTGEDPGDPDARKPVTGADWTDRFLEAEEIAGIVVIPENVIDDAEPDFNLWGEIRPRIAEAVGATLDGAVFFGTNAPASWVTNGAIGLVPAAVAAGNVYVEGGSTVDIAEDINQTIALVEDDGYDVSDAYARRRLRAQLRGLRDDNNQPIIQSPTAGSNVPSLYGADLQWVTNGSWVNADAKLLVGDASKAVLGLRQDITYKFLDQASVTLVVEGVPTLVSLAENDLVGLRFKMRVGFQTAETPTKDGGSDAFPFAVLQPEPS
jgi:HK97 family phage major capsid protein